MGRKNKRDTDHTFFVRDRDISKGKLFPCNQASIQAGELSGDTREEYLLWDGVCQRYILELGENDAVRDGMHRQLQRSMCIKRTVRETSNIK